MPTFSKASLAKLDTCHPTLQLIMNEAIKHKDFTVLEGHRDKATQDRYFAEGKTKLKWPDGKHCSDPSLAIDIAPWIHGKVSFDKHHCIYLAGLIMALAAVNRVHLRWGGDWDEDGEPITDQTFNELVHFEIVE